MTALTGRILYPGDPGWDEARKGFALWADYDANVPRVIVFCQNTQDVANAVRWARENKVPLRPRCGRHSYEAYSSLIKDGIIIDVSPMNSVQASRDNPLAQVGAGLQMEDLFEALGELGLTIPGATGPTVGLAGLVLGSGFGVTSRKWGLTCDNLVDIELVTADGEIVHANAQENSDLFWACRGGGGGNFGIATTFTFTVHKVANVAVYNITWSWDQFDAVVRRWQAWAPEVDEGLSSALALLATRDINMYGQFTAEDQELPRIYSLLAPMLTKTPPLSLSVQIMPHLQGTRVIMELDPRNPQANLIPHSDDQIFKSTSSFAYKPFPPKAIQTLRTYLEETPALSCSPSQPSMVQLLGGGGYPSRIPPDATAVFARQAKFVVQYDAYWTAPEDGAKTVAWIEAFRNAMAPYTSGAYVNYVDASIQDWQRAYYGTNLERLVEVKRKYDPENVFNFAQSIPLSLS
jgi:FAD/FMN-containing dehydrogenase